MNLDINKHNHTVNGITIKKIPAWWLRIPGFSQLRGVPLVSSFLLKEDLFDELFCDEPGAFLVGLVLHEIEHLGNARRMGAMKYHIWYRVSPTFRYTEELRCHRPQFAYYKSVGYQFDLEGRAKVLSGAQYLWCVSQKKALQDLQDLWDTLEIQYER